jgi:hypothetical protein
MKKYLPITIILMLLVIALSACNLPSSELSPADKTATIDAAVAETVQAGIDQAQDTTDQGGNGNGSDSGDTTEEVPPSETPEAPPTDTPDIPTPTPTSTTVPCNLAQFITDVTVPDGTVYEPGDVFDKTWRLKNVGSCAWTAGYEIVFAGGDAMDAPSAVSVTAGTVNPGQSVDITVTMTAPADEGTYRGNWRMRDPSDVIFDIQNSSSGMFWVEIEVEEAAPTEQTVEINLSSRGMVFDGVSTHTNANNAGDNGDDVGIQGFVTYDLSGIPDGATIKRARLIKVSHDVLGDPFGSLGCLRAYVHNYGSVGFEDFKPAGVTGAIVRFCSEADLSDSTDQLMNSIGIAGIENALASDSFQIRLQFKDMHTDGDGVADVFRGSFKLAIVYEAP